jgi:hypothetical protein
MILVMKVPHLRSSCVNRNTTLSPPPATNVVAAEFPAIALRPTLTLPPEKQRLSPTRIDGGQVLSSAAGRHLWLVLRSEENRRGALWETAGFLAIWLSGLVGVAICVL